MWLKMVETPQYNPPVDLRVSGNSNDTSKSQNQHVDFWSIFEILIFQVLAHGFKIVEPKRAKNGGNPSVLTPTQYKSVWKFQQHF